MERMELYYIHYRCPGCGYQTMLESPEFNIRHLDGGEEDEYPSIKCDECSRYMEVMDAQKTIGIPVFGRCMC